MMKQIGKLMGVQVRKSPASVSRFLAPSQNVILNTTNKTSYSFGYPNNLSTCDIQKKRLMSTTTTTPPPTTTDDVVPPPENVNYIVEVDQKNFVGLIADPNQKVPVILDCYADWCQPCKELTPLLEEEVKKYGGKVILAKLNTEKMPELVQSLQITGLPTVFAVSEGKLVDKFEGMLPAEKVGLFVKNVEGFNTVGTVAGNTSETVAEAEPAVPVGPTNEEILAGAEDLLKEGNATEAGEVFKKLYAVLSKEETPSTFMQAQCLVGLGECALMSGAETDAKQLVKMLQDGFKDAISSVPDLSKRVAAMDVKLSMEKAEGDEESLKEAIAKDPLDFDSRYNLALYYFQNGKEEDAINEALEIVKKDKTWNEGKARDLLLKIFESVSPELAKKGRRRLQNFLF